MKNIDYKRYGKRMIFTIIRIGYIGDNFVEVYLKDAKLEENGSSFRSATMNMVDAKQFFDAKEANDFIAKHDSVLRNAEAVTLVSHMIN